MYEFVVCVRCDELRIRTQDAVGSTTDSEPGCTLYGPGYGSARTACISVASVEVTLCSLSETVTGNCLVISAIIISTVHGIISAIIVTPLLLHLSLGSY